MIISVCVNTKIRKDQLHETPKKKSKKNCLIKIVPLKLIFFYKINFLQGVCGVVELQRKRTENSNSLYIIIIIIKRSKIKYKE